MKQIATAIAVALTLAGLAAANRTPVPTKRPHLPKPVPTVIGCVERTDGYPGYTCREVSTASGKVVAKYLFVKTDTGLLGVRHPAGPGQPTLGSTDGIGSAAATK